jgi:hypothetical protein
MCPDGQILSAWIDGEIPAALERGIRKHIESCSACGERLSSVSRVTELFANDTFPDEERVRERVWTRVLLGRASTSQRPIWRKTLNVPIPVAAAILAGLLTLGGLFLFSPGSRNKMTVADLPPEFMRQLAVTIKVDSMDQLLEFLSSQERLGEITIELPETSRLEPFGEPEFLRAAEYTGRVPR